MDHLDCSIDPKVSSVIVVHAWNLGYHGFWDPDLPTFTDDFNFPCFQKLLLPISRASQMSILPPSRIMLLRDCKMRKQSGFYTYYIVTEIKWSSILKNKFQGCQKVRSSRQYSRYQVLSACLVMQACTQQEFRQPLSPSQLPATQIWLG